MYLDKQAVQELMVMMVLAFWMPTKHFLKTTYDQDPCLPWEVNAITQIEAVPTQTKQSSALQGHSD
jgi:hypothetical protein